MEENKNIDKQFRDALGNYKVQPPDRVKDAVFAQLDELKKSNRPLFGWITGISVVVISVLLGWWWLNSDYKSIGNTTISEAVAQTPNPPVENANAKKISNTPTAVELKAETSNTPKVENTTYINSSLGSINKNIDKKRNFTVKNSERNKETLNNNSQEVSNSDKSEKVKIESLENNLVAKTNESSNNSDEIIQGNSIKEKAEVAPSNDVVPISRVEKPESTEVNKQPDADKKASAFSLEVSTGPSFYKSRIGSDKVVNSEYIELLDDALTSTLSWNANVEIAMQLNKNVYLQTGINYDWINQDFSYTNPAPVLPPMPTPEVNYLNRLEYLNIPLLVGLKFGKDKITFNVQGGISYGILTKATGYTIDFDTKDAVAIDKSIMNSSLMAALFRASLNYQVNDKIGLFIQPAGRLNFKSITKSSAPASIELSKFSINAGLHIKF